ncbi:hypothetical protein MSG28_000879 [Choristoneura fumiferana]|uniref:Uncharacterized protein n=1 Tax=Choristoneura fumiferana TaxID=7141 RepID=A0ACC0K3B2_CHOFU|nr:hypothetical protein MSG28_000879 [Choristoneura fumiferana]
MTYFNRRDNYRALSNEPTPPLRNLVESANAAPMMLTLDHEHEDATNVIIHKVPKNKGGWTHIEDLDSFFTRMYTYYIRGGFYPMIISDLFYLLQFVFIIWFSTFLVHCVNYPVLFRNDPNANRSEKLSFNDVIYSCSECVEFISWHWWCLIILCSVIWLMRLVLSIYHLYYAYDTKQFYNSALKIQDSDLVWVSWGTVQDRVREAQPEHHMCVHKQEINELDIYHRILRFNNYMVAMVNKSLLPLQIHVPFAGDFHYLSKGLKWNLEFLLFSSPWSPWENCWQLRECYKDHSKRMILARQLERQIMFLALINLLLTPLIQAWQILYFFFNYAELIKRSPASLGLRTWSLYARVTLRHFNELEHELRDRLNRAHKPATKYLARMSFFFLRACSAFWSCSRFTTKTFSRALIGEEERLGGGCTGPARGEELFVQVLGHVHYLPAAWRGRAHTKDVAAHFQQLFQFRAVYILFELLSPLLCPVVLFRLRTRALDNKTMLGSYIQQSIFGTNTPLPAVLSYYQQRQPYRLPDMDETSDEDEDAETQASSSAGPRLMGQSQGSRLGASGLAPTGLGTSALGLAADPPPDESRDMSVSTLHLYDLHISQAAPTESACCVNNCSERQARRGEAGWGSGEEMPLLHRP